MIRLPFRRGMQKEKKLSLDDLLFISRVHETPSVRAEAAERIKGMLCSCDEQILSYIESDTALLESVRESARSQLLSKRFSGYSYRKLVEIFESSSLSSIERENITMEIADRIIRHVGRYGIEGWVNVEHSIIHQFFALDFFFGKKLPDATREKVFKKLTSSYSKPADMLFGIAWKYSMVREKALLEYLKYAPLRYDTASLRSLAYSEECTTYYGKKLFEISHAVRVKAGIEYLHSLGVSGHDITEIIMFAYDKDIGLSYAPHAPAEVRDEAARILIRRVGIKDEETSECLVPYHYLVSISKYFSEDVKLEAAQAIISSFEQHRDYSMLEYVALGDFPEHIRSTAVIKMIEGCEIPAKMLSISIDKRLPPHLREGIGLRLIGIYAEKSDYESLLRLDGRIYLTDYSDSESEDYDNFHYGGWLPECIVNYARELAGDVALTKAYALAQQGDYTAVHGIASDSRLPEPVREEVGQVGQYAAAVRIEQLTVKGDYDALSAMAKEGIVSESMRALASSVVEIAEARKIGEAARSGQCETLARIASDESASGISRMVADQHLRQSVRELAQSL